MASSDFITYMRWADSVRKYRKKVVDDANVAVYAETGVWPTKNGTSTVDYSYLFKLDPSADMIHLLFTDSPDKLDSVKDLAAVLKAHPECWQFTREQAKLSSELEVADLVASVGGLQVKPELQEFGDRPMAVALRPFAVAAAKDEAGRKELKHLVRLLQQAAAPFSE